MGFQGRKAKLVVFVVAGALVLVGTSAAVATHVATHWASSGGVVKQVKVVGSTAAAATEVETWSQLPGSTVFFSIPAGQTDLILARFIGESECTGNQEGDGCILRIVVKNTATAAITELNPKSGTDLAFDGVPSANDWWESNAVERSARLPGGSYAAFVQYAVAKDGASFARFQLDDWHFAVERIE